MSKEDAVWYDIDCAPIPLCLENISSLYEMFDHPGWKIFMELRIHQAKDAIDEGMDLVRTDEYRAMQRANYHGLAADIVFEDSLKREVKETEPKTFASIDKNPTMVDAIFK